jgi:signal transduction histidine kinase
MPLMERRRSAWNHDANTTLATHVLVAQEAERRRVGRDLHDDLAQKVALLEFEIEGMRRRFRSQPHVLAELHSLSGCVATLAEDVHRICCRLHPVVLDNLGLVRGVAFLCEEHSRTSGMQTVFQHDNIPERLPANISLCLYRVIQEALQNAAKHSWANAATVTLHAVESGIRAVVSDTGRGFDMNAASAKAGLGLVFISERLRLLGGRCIIRSTPGAGTRISAFVPLACSDDDEVHLEIMPSVAQE